MTAFCSPRLCMHLRCCMYSSTSSSSTSRETRAGVLMARCSFLCCSVEFPVKFILLCLCGSFSEKGSSHLALFFRPSQYEILPVGRSCFGELYPARATVSIARKSVAHTTIFYYSNPPISACFRRFTNAFHTCLFS